MTDTKYNITGLTEDEVILSRDKHGKNIIKFEEPNWIVELAISLVSEPMIILLLVTSSIYFVMGNRGDALFLALAIVLVGAISWFQDSRSRIALKKLKAFIQPNSKVIRNRKVIEIPSEEIVIGDSILVEEGATIAADGSIIRSNDFSVNESILTGESFSVLKDVSTADNLIYKGTTVSSGLAIATVIAIGKQTKLGKIGQSLEKIQKVKSPLELQISGFVKKMVFAGIVVFIFVWALNYSISRNLLDSLLKALTIAMSILPEEIPVAFTTFMALGSWRLMNKGVVVKKMNIIETLGSATVICTDKTGTITENKMSLAKVFTPRSNSISDPDGKRGKEVDELITYAMWSSEPIPFDPMEIALHEAYKQYVLPDERGNYSMIHEYPLGGRPPMMTHIFQDKKGTRIIAAKGAPEAILKIANMSSQTKKEAYDALKSLTQEGYRVLGVGKGSMDNDHYPDNQENIPFEFIGLVAFYDPPKKNIEMVFEKFYNAGIDVKILTGDNAATTASVARQIHFEGSESGLSGEELMALSDTEVQRKVVETHIFSRMFPEAKLKIINALKANNEIVAMTGDGVNDSPALKAAHIGVAMGKKGTETAKQVAALILVDDDLSKMIEAIAMGRRIYANLKKAIQYIISIHIPIILAVFLPLTLGWIYPHIFTPVHIIFMELIMGPTCSIIYENEPLEKNAMSEKPRSPSTTFFNSHELMTSIIQGLMITAGILIIYQYAVLSGCNEAVTRTMVFTCLISANVFLTLVNRSFYYSILSTLQYKNPLVLLIIGITIIITALLLTVPFFTAFFKFDFISIHQLCLSIAAGFLSVIWYEGVKWRKRST